MEPNITKGPQTWFFFTTPCYAGMRELGACEENIEISLSTHCDGGGGGILSGSVSGIGQNQLTAGKGGGGGWPEEKRIDDFVLAQLTSY